MIIMYVLEVISIIGLVTFVILWRQTLTAYSTEKGKNLATKEDIGKITREIESVKLEFSNVDSIAQQKRLLKYEACLEALSIIDAHLSHSFINPNPTPQIVSTEKARAAHSKLILSCDNLEIVEKFGEIYFGPEAGVAQRPLTDLLNEFRNLIRKELGFAIDDLNFDRDRVWIGRSLGDSNNPNP